MFRGGFLIYTYFWNWKLNSPDGSCTIHSPLSIMQPPVGPNEDAMVILLKLYCVFCISVVINVITNYKQLSCVLMSVSVCVYEFQSFLALSFPIAKLGIEDSFLTSICNGRRLFSLFLNTYFQLTALAPQFSDGAWCWCPGSTSTVLLHFGFPLLSMLSPIANSCFVVFLCQF
jgi:hypothetical protein